MNAVVKISGVSSEGLARLLQLIESKENKIATSTANVYVEDPSKGPDHSESVKTRLFRFAKVQKVEPESNGETYLVTLKVCFKVWDADRTIHRLDRNTHLRLFRALDERNLPPPNNREKLEKMASLLLSLQGKSLPYEICEGDGSVIIQADTPLTVELIFQKIFPRLELVELHGYHPQRQPSENNEGIQQLFEAKDIAKSLV